MPKIISSTSLRNEYNEVSSWCHESSEPAFVTKNGAGDLAVMSIEAYERLVGQFRLYTLLREGMEDISSGNTRPFFEAMRDIRERRKK